MRLRLLLSLLFSLHLSPPPLHPLHLLQLLPLHLLHLLQLLPLYLVPCSEYPAQLPWFSALLLWSSAPRTPPPPPDGASPQRPDSPTPAGSPGCSSGSRRRTTAPWAQRLPTSGTRPRPGQLRPWPESAPGWRWWRAVLPPPARWEFQPGSVLPGAGGCRRPEGRRQLREPERSSDLSRNGKWKRAPWCRLRNAAPQNEPAGRRRLRSGVLLCALGHCVVALWSWLKVKFRANTNEDDDDATEN